MKSTNKIKYEDLTAIIQRGKFGEYYYTSPSYFRKKAYKYDMIIWLYINNHFIKKIGFKNTGIKKIVDYLKDYRTTPEYIRKVNKAL